MPPTRPLLFWLFLLCLLCPALLQARPRRIVSTCLSGDQLLLELVPRDEIAALSWMAVDPDLSPHWKEARGIPATHGSMEELVRLKPDLVLEGVYSTRKAILQRLGVPVLEIGIPNDFDELRAQIREVAHRLGTEERAEAILRKMDAALERLAAERVRAAEPRPTALLLFEGGYTPGGKTFANALLEAAGFENLGKNFQQTAAVPLEAALLARPRFLLLTRYREKNPTATQLSARHPLLRALSRNAEMEVVSVPFRHLACPDPGNLELVESLHQRLLSHAQPASAR